MSDWQPIETVPIDGREILLFCQFAERAEIAVAKYVAPRGSGQFGDFVWQLQNDGGTMAEQVPTHWMPLPEPPVQK